MRILHIADLQKMGGLEWIFIEFLRHQPKNFPVENVLLNERSSCICPTIADEVHKRCKGVTFSKEISGVTLPKMPRCIRVWNRRRLIKASKADVILIWSQFPDLGKSPLYNAAPMLYYEHGLAWFEYNSAFMRRFFGHMSACIATSNAAQRVLQLKHHVKTPMHVVQNALRPSARPFTEQTARHLPVDRPVRIGVAARLASLKCVGLLVLTIKALREKRVNAEGWIAGTGPEEASIRALVAREGVADFIRFQGFVDVMDSFYREIDLSMVTSMHETAPLSCIEPLAYGVPVVCGAIEGMAELIEDNVTGILLTPDMDIPTYSSISQQSTDMPEQVYDVQTDTLIPPKVVNPNTFAEAIACLIAQPDRYHQMSEQALQTTNKKFDFSRQAEELYELLYRYHCR